MKKQKSQKRLKILVASVLGLSMMFCVPHVPATIGAIKDSVVQTVNQETNPAKLEEEVQAKALQEKVLTKSKQNAKAAAISTNIKVGAKTQELTGNNGATAQNAGTKTEGRDKVGLSDDSQLPSTVTGNWLDDLASVKTLSDLMGKTQAEHNIFQKPQDESGVYKIDNAEEFAFFAKAIQLRGNSNTTEASRFNNQTFKLTQDIDLTGKAWTPIFNFLYNQDCTINFDGAGFTIKNAYIKVTENDGVAQATSGYNTSIFGGWCKGKISNVKIENANIQSYWHAGIVSYSESATVVPELEKVTVKNSKVVGGTIAVGLGYNLNTVTDCVLENCEVLGTDTDSTLFNKTEGYVDNILNVSATRYVYGFGRVKNVTKSTDGTCGLKNTKVAFESTADQYNGLTASATRTINVAGIGCWDSNTAEDFTYSDIKIENSDIFSKVEIKDAKSAATKPATDDYSLWTSTTNVNVYGVAQVGYNGAFQQKVSFDKLNLINSKIYSDYKYQPTQSDADNNKDMLFANTNNVQGVGDSYSTLAETEAIKFSNVTLENCEVYGNSTMDVKHYATSRRPVAGGYREVFTMTENISGVGRAFFSDNTTFEQVQIKDSKVNGNITYDCVDDSSYSVSTTNNVAGISRSNYNALFTNCTVENSDVKALSDVDQGIETQGTDYYNMAYLYGDAMGIGRGTFNEVTVKTSNVISQMKEMQNTNTEVNKQNPAGSSYAIGIGRFKSNGETTNTKLTLENCNVEATSQYYLPTLAIGLLRNAESASGTTLTESKILNTTIKSTTKNNIAYVAGLLFNDGNQLTEGGKYALENNTVTNLKIEAGTDVNALVTAGIYNSVEIAEGITLKKNTFDQVSAERTGEEGRNITVMATGAYNVGKAKVDLLENTVSNSTLKNETTNAATGKETSAIAGLAYISNTKIADNVQQVYDNKVENVSLLNKIESKTNFGHELLTVGMVYNSSAAKMEYKNNTVHDSTIKSETNGASTLTSGMGIQTTDRKSTYEECYAYNNDVESVFSSGGTNASQSTAAFGLNAGYAKTITNCVVGSGKVLASNAVGNATAAGVGYTRGWNGDYNYKTSTKEEDLVDCQITGCVNFSDVTATTESNYVTYASGIGRAEIFEGCANYGNVTGNYAGGITSGVIVNGNNQVDKQSSIPLTLKNNLNAGNICRPTSGSTSYLGGLVGVYWMGYTANFKLVLENNVSLGGVYSRLDQSSGEYSQNLSTGTYLGMLYGYFYLQNYNKDYTDISIKNNYMHIENNGFNGGLWQENKVADTEFFGVDNTPSTNYIATREGVFYNTNNLATNKEKLKQVSNCLKIDSQANTNTYFGAYTGTTFNQNEAYAEYASKNGWKTWTVTSGTIPTVETTRERLLVVYSLGEHDGTVPNVQIVEKTGEQYTFETADKQIDDTDIITQVGVSLKDWKVKEGTTYQPNTAQNLSESGILHLTAEVDWTEYTIEIEKEDNMSVTYEIGSAQQSSDFKISLNTENAVLKSSYTAGDNALKAVDWQVKSKDAEAWTLIQTKSVSNSATDTELKISDFINSEFLSQYATTDGKIKIKAAAVKTALFAFTVKDNNPEGEGHYSLTATYDGHDAINNPVTQGSEVQISIKVDDYYTIEEVKTSTGDSVSSEGDGQYKISSMTKATELSVKVKKIDYKVNLQIQNLQGVTLDSSLVDTLFEDVSSQTVSVEEDLPQIKAKTDVVGYRFVGFKLVGMSDYISATDGQIDTGFKVSNDDFGKYISAGLSPTFNIIAVYQRQYRVNVTLNNEFDESFASQYELCYTDENGDYQQLTNVQDDETILNSGSYMIDENTFIELKIKPNKRVSTIAPKGEQFGNNTVYIYLTGDKNITIDFAVRDIAINRGALNVLKPEDDEKETTSTQAYQLTSAITYDITSETGDSLGDEGQTQTVSVNNRITFGYDADTLANAHYRFISLRLLNVLTGEYDEIECGQEYVLSNEFFDKYVNEQGEFVVSMKIIKQYTAQINAENMQDDDYTLGAYTVQILDENGEEADAERYVINEANKSYTLDNGLKLVITPTVENKYAQFDGFVGLFEGEDESEGQTNKASVSMTDNRSISVRFEKTTFTLDLSYNAGVGGTLDYTKSFQLGDTVSISYSPKSNFQVKEWRINGKSLSDIGAVQNGNTITFVATEEALDALFGGTIPGDDVFKVNTNISTAMSPIILYGVIAGGALIVILAGVVTFLMLRSRKLKKQKEENEKKLNAIARKVNIADMINDLKK